MHKLLQMDCSGSKGNLLRFVRGNSRLFLGNVVSFLEDGGRLCLNGVILLFNVDTCLCSEVILFCLF